MRIVLEKLQIFLVVKLLWLRKSIKHNAIRSFQATEDDGVWHLHTVFNETNDPKVKAEIFTHILEEASHATIFKRAFEEEAGINFSRQYYERQDLHSRNDALWKKLAFVHIGERDATNRFRALIQFLDDCPLKTALISVVEDEEGHIELTRKMVDNYHDNPQDIEDELKQIEQNRFKETCARALNRFFNFTSTSILYFIYFLVAPFCFYFVKRKFSNPIVSYDNNFSKRLDS
jgi:rubrerythrin